MPPQASVMILTLVLTGSRTEASPLHSAFCSDCSGMLVAAQYFCHCAGLLWVSKMCWHNEGVRLIPPRDVSYKVSDHSKSFHSSLQVRSLGHSAPHVSFWTMVEPLELWSCSHRRIPAPPSFIPGHRQGDKHPTPVVRHLSVFLDF